MPFAGLEHFWIKGGNLFIFREERNVEKTVENVDNYL